jgi:glucokinase
MATTNGNRGGIDLGGTKVQAVVVDDEHQVLGAARRPTPTTGGPPDVIEAMATTLEEAAAAAGMTTASLRGVGVGAPGPIDADTGTLLQATNLPSWDDPYPLGAELSAKAGTPVSLGNDVGVAVAAEFELGAGKSHDSLLGVWWGTGVGGGLYLGGQQWRGRGAAGEIGHMVVDIGGRPEPSGLRLRGTMEAYAGRAAMEARARRLVEKGHETKLFEIMAEKGKPRLASGVWAKALRKRDKVAVLLIDDAVAAIGAAAASAVNLLDIGLVVIGGGLGSRLGQPYADRIAEAMMPHLLVAERAPSVAVAELGDLGGAIGAALLAQVSPARTL